MAQNWEDEFDLLDEPKKKKNNQKERKSKAEEDDFFDLEDDSKAVKLPSLNTRGGNKPAERQSKIKEDVTLEEIYQKSSKKVVENQYEFQVQYKEPVAPEPVSYLHQALKQNDREEPKGTNQPSEKEEEEEDYGEENFEEEKYDEDFEENVENKPSPVVEKPKQQKKQTKKPVNVPKPPSRNRLGVGSVTKKQEISSRVNSRGNNSRGNSRGSAYSYEKRSAHSKTRVEQKDTSKDVPNKYMNFTEKHCPTYDKQVLQKFDLDKLTRQNQRVRTTIKKLNDELNDLINKNIMQLKGKKNEKEINADQTIKQLEQIKSSNETALQNSMRQLAKLKDKEGALGQEDYHLTLDQKLLDAKNSINELNKIITKLNVGVGNQGKKLAKMDKIDKENPTIEMGNIKVGMINTQKDYDKNEEKLKKMDVKLQDLTQKVAEYQGKLSQHLEEAKRKGVMHITNPQLYKKGQQFKKKIDAVKQYKAKTQGLYKTKCDMLNHQNDQLRSQIKTLQGLTLNCHANCEQMQNQSRKAVEKARRNGRIAPDVINNLENIIMEMERGVSTSQESLDQRVTFTHPKGTKKYQSLKNVEKVLPPQQKQPEKVQDDINMKKPFLLKKKKDEDEKMAKSYRTEAVVIEPKVQRQIEKPDERVWKESNSPKKSQKHRDSAAELANFQDKQQKKQEQKKKPFMIKKSRDKLLSEEHKQSPKVQTKAEVKEHRQEPKNEETPSVAPRMIKFKKKQPEQTPKEQSHSKIQLNDKNVTPPAVEQKINVEEDDKPAFVPRRFNLKAKERKSQEGGYVASTLAEKKQQPKVEEEKPKGLTIDNTEPAPKPVEEEQKPRFNLKLKNRQKENKNIQTKIQPQPIKQQITEQPQAKVMISLNDQPKPSKQNSNPYAPTNPYAQSYESNKRIKKEKEGPIKEHKAAQNAPKQKYDLFGQAQDLTNVQEIKNDSPKPVPSYVPSKQQNDELDLNALLGKPKEKKVEVDNDLLVDDTLFGKK